MTSLQARTVGEKLETWLRGRNLKIKTEELECGTYKPVKIKIKQVEVDIGSKDRKFIRSFIKFCKQSEGFKVW